MIDIDELERRAEALAAESYAELWSLVAETASILCELAPGQRRPWLTSVIYELRDAQDGKCALCGEALMDADMEVDHKVPFCYGGGNERGNIQLAHTPCNRRKRTRVDPRELLRYLEDRYMNR